MTQKIKMNLEKLAKTYLVTSSVFDTDHVYLAKDIAYLAHEGQFRKDGITPYISHVEAVANNFDDDLESQTMAWLHDVVEDSDISLNMLSLYFPSSIVEGVNYLTRNVGKDEYKVRLSSAPKKVQEVKLADMEHNTSDMKYLDYASHKRLISKKVFDATQYYIPLAKRIGSHKFADDIVKHISIFGGIKK